MPAQILLYTGAAFTVAAYAMMALLMLEIAP